MLRDGPVDARKPSLHTPCQCHYRGSVIDGREFDSSYARAAPATLAPSEVVGGGIVLMLCVSHEL